MTPFEMDCIDYDDQPGKVTVALAHRDHGPAIRLTAHDCDGGSIVYPTADQAKEIIVALLTAIREIQHGPQTD